MAGRKTDRGDGSDLHVVLVRPEIPWNTGNAGRTCLAAGARLHLVRPLGFSLAAREVRRAGLDYWTHVEPRVWSSWAVFEEALPELGRPWLFTAEASRDLWSVPIEEPAVLVFGAETGGLSPDLRRRFAERLVRIPMRDGPVRSLNLSTSVAIAVYEVLRRRVSAPSASKPRAVRSRDVRTARTVVSRRSMTRDSGP